MNLDLDISKQSYVEPSLRKNMLDGFTYLPEESSEDRNVYKKNNKIKVGYRGSTTTRDWLSNVEYLSLGREKIDPQYIKDDIHFSKLKEANPNADISVTGHSRGGSRADAISRKYKVPTTGFNPASTPMDILKPINPLKTTYRTALDPVSLFGKNLPGVNTIVGKSKGLAQAHALTEFDNPLFIK